MVGRAVVAVDPALDPVAHERRALSQRALLRGGRRLGRRAALQREDLTRVCASGRVRGHGGHGREPCGLVERCETAHSRWPLVRPHPPSCPRLPGCPAVPPHVASRTRQPQPRFGVPSLAGTSAAFATTRKQLFFMYYQAPLRPASFAPHSRTRLVSLPPAFGALRRAPRAATPTPPSACAC